VYCIIEEEWVFLEIKFLNQFCSLFVGARAQHNNIIFIDFDQLTQDGEPAVKIAYPHSTFKIPYSLSLVSVRNKKMKILGSIKITS
jgi:hypothetical protein